MNYTNNIKYITLDNGEVVEVDTTPEKVTFPKEESILDTLYASAIQQREDRIENEGFTQRG